nr:marginal zone B- and B1-cell-specific protein [Meriones unguiculatus]
MRLPLLLLFGCGALLGSLGDKASLSATAPMLDDEEKYSSHMPAHLHCDACRAVAYQMGQHLAKAEARSHAPDSSGLQELSESAYVDALDRTCSQNWQSYGVQEVNQVKRLMGPGLSKAPKPQRSVPSYSHIFLPPILCSFTQCHSPDLPQMKHLAANGSGASKLPRASSRRTA